MTTEEFSVRCNPVCKTNNGEKRLIIVTGRQLFAKKTNSSIRFYCHAVAFTRRVKTVTQYKAAGKG